MASNGDSTGGGGGGGGAAGRRRSMGRMNTVEDQALNMIHREVRPVNQSLVYCRRGTVFDCFVSSSF